MAILNAVKPTTNNRTADAFMNIAVVDQAGVKHNLRTGVALYATNKLDAAIIAKFASDENASLDVVVTSVRSNTSVDAEYDL